MPCTRLPGITTLAPILLVAGSLLAGCGQPAAIGNPCSVGSPGGSQEVTISTPALECASRICLQVGGGGPLCTAACASDDDCVNLAPAAGARCRLGFTCRAASPFGAHPCQRLCLCRDDGLPPEQLCR
jgi:hypothetical protein